MASFFGEVLPLSSRVIDDEDLVKYDLLLEKIEEFSKTSINFVVFSVGAIANVFVSNFFLKEDPKCLAIVKYRKVGEEDDLLMYSGLKREREITIAYAYWHNNVICCQIEGVPEALNVDLCSKLLEEFPTEKALVLTSRYKSEYKSVDSVQRNAPFIRALTSSKFLKCETFGIPLLSPPNIVANFPAALITAFELTGKSVLCVVNYVENFDVDSINMEAIQAILEEIYVNSNISISTSVEDRWVNCLKHNSFINSNLYI